MSTPLVILHGWSATSEGFRPLARHLRSLLGRDVALISLADYLSMEDEIRFDDLATAMDKAWQDHALPREKRSVDAVVHSTGGPVIRHWLSRHFEPDQAPIHHLLMLAPANFGSPLAHKGRSFLARLVKGSARKKPQGQAFETGTQVLKGLELASPYTWHLAMDDRFGEGGRMYGPENVLCTVLVGNRGYEGVRSIWNENGSDGTVRVSTANMNCVHITASLPIPPDDGKGALDAEWELEESSGSTAFGVLDLHDHGSIKLPKRSVRSQRDKGLLDDVREALTVEDEGFPGWCKKLEDRNRALPTTTARRHGFQNTVVRVQDQYGVGIGDYVLEFHEKDNDRTARWFHGTSIKGVHKYSDDASFRSIYIDCTRLRSSIDKVGEYLSMSVTAHPEINPPYTYVGFKSLAHLGIGVRINRDKIRTFFAPNRTALVTLRIKRLQSDDVFRFKRYSESSG